MISQSIVDTSGHWPGGQNEKNGSTTQLYVKTVVSKIFLVSSPFYVTYTFVIILLELRTFNKKNEGTWENVSYDYSCSLYKKKKEE